MLKVRHLLERHAVTLVLVSLVACTAMFVYFALVAPELASLKKRDVSVQSLYANVSPLQFASNLYEVHTMLFLVGYLVLFCLCGLPIGLGYTLLAIAAGYTVGGSCFVCALTMLSGSASVSAALVFALVQAQPVRRGISKWLKRRPKLTALTSVVRASGFPILFLCRLIPIPFGIQNTVFAASGVPFRTFITSTTLGLLPEQVLSVYAGSQMKSYAANPSSEGSSLFQGAFIFALASIVSLVGKRSLDNEMKNVHTRVDVNLSTAQGIVELLRPKMGGVV
jgi:uncharacterized membrane protein YdjX (TVP38/TMEM64 family)